MVDAQAGVQTSPVQSRRWPGAAEEEERAALPRGSCFIVVPLESTRRRQPRLLKTGSGQESAWPVAPVAGADLPGTSSLAVAASTGSRSPGLLPTHRWTQRRSRQCETRWRNAVRLDQVPRPAPVRATSGSERICPDDDQHRYNNAETISARRSWRSSAAGPVRRCGAPAGGRVSAGQGPEC